MDQGDVDVLRVDYAKKWLDDCEWMSQVPAFSSGAAVWHMHPVVFLDAIRETNQRGWAHSPFANLIGNAESRNDYTAYNRTHPHLVAYSGTNLTSMTLAQVMVAQNNRE